LPAVEPGEIIGIVILMDIMLRGMIGNVP